MSVAETPVILFDGVCKLCSAWTNFIIKYDAEHRFRLCSVQSAAGQRLLAQHGYPTDIFETMLVSDGRRCFEKSAAFFFVMNRLGWPWRGLLVFRLIPRPLRDWLYDRIALNRYRLFGRYQLCQLPSADHAGRFVDE